MGTVEVKTDAHLRAHMNAHTLTCVCASVRAQTPHKLCVLINISLFQDAFEFISECAGEVGGVEEACALQVATPIISALEHVHALGFAHCGE